MRTLAVYAVRARLCWSVLTAYVAAARWLAPRILQLARSPRARAAASLTRALDPRRSLGSRRDAILNQLAVGTLAGVVTGLAITLFH